MMKMGDYFGVRKFLGMVTKINTLSMIGLGHTDCPESDSMSWVLYIFSR
jgi:hypothetical protein